MPIPLLIMTWIAFGLPFGAFIYAWIFGGSEFVKAHWKWLAVFASGAALFYIVSYWIGVGPRNSIWFLLWFMMSVGFTSLFIEHAVKAAERDGRRHKPTPGQNYVLYQATFAIALVPSVAIVIGWKLLFHGAVTPWDKMNTAAVVILAVCLAAVLKEVWLRSKARGVSTDD